MQIRRISFQGNDNPDHKFSDDYQEFCKCGPDAEAAMDSEPVKQMQLELLRRMRKMEGRDAASSESVEQELERKLSRGMEEFMRRVKMMLILLRKLEDEYSGPPYWACTSHYDVSFSDRDFSSYSDTPQDRSDIKLCVGVTINDSDQAEFHLTTCSGKTLLCTTDIDQAIEKSADVLGARPIELKPMP